MRDIERKAAVLDAELLALLDLARRLHAQERQHSNKLYSFHEPHVECISKGKVHKKYEFGCKICVAITAQRIWAVASMAFHGNPYDGHTLEQILRQVKRLQGSLLSRRRAISVIGATIMRGIARS